MAITTTTDRRSSLLASTTAFGTGLGHFGSALRKPKLPQPIHAHRVVTDAIDTCFRPGAPRHCRLPDAEWTAWHAYLQQDVARPGATARPSAWGDGMGPHGDGAEDLDHVRPPG